MLSFLMKSTRFFVAITCTVCMRSIGGRIPTLTTAETRAGPHGHHGLGRHGHGEHLDTFFVGHPQ